MQRIKIILTVLIGAAVIAAGAFYYTQHNAADASEAEAAAQPAPPPPAPGVTYIEVATSDLPRRYDRLGVVEASRQAEVHARVRGYLAERLFVEGQQVEAGDLLYRIEKDTFQSEVLVQEAELADARGRMELAKRELKRTKDLSDTGAIAQEQLDEAEIELDRAQAAVAKAEASLQEAKLDLGFTEIVAPVSGIVGKAVRDDGDLVDDNSNSLLTTITRISPIYVTYGVSEADHLELHQSGDDQPGHEVEYSLILSNGETFDELGKLNYQSPNYEPSTGMMRIRIEFANEGGVLRPNQFVKLIEDHGIRKDVVTVPKKSIIQSPAGPAVFVIDENDVLQFRPVNAGKWRGDDWVVASGLAAGERVMVEGLMKSRPGSPVNPSPYTQTQ